MMPWEVPGAVVGGLSDAFDSMQTTVRLGISEAAATARSGIDNAAQTVQVVGPSAADAAANAGMAAIGAEILAAVGLPTVVLGTAVGAALVDQVATGGKGRRAIVAALF